MYALYMQCFSFLQENESDILTISEYVSKYCLNKFINEKIILGLMSYALVKFQNDIVDEF